MKQFAAIALLFVFLVGIVPATSAHEVSYAAPSTSLVVDGSATVAFETIVNGLAIGAGAEATEEVLAIGSSIYTSNFALSANGESCTAEMQVWNWSDEEQTTLHSGIYTCPVAVTLENLSLADTLFTNLFETYDHYVRINTAEGETDIILNREQNLWPENAATDPIGPGAISASDTDSDNRTVTLGQETKQSQTTLLPVLNRFTRLGIDHIIFGFDHVLFVLALILVVVSVKDIIKLVTGFTIAHSVTLLLAGFDIVIVSPDVVEPIIALSIVYMAGRNIWLHRKGQDVFVKERFAATLGFGLIHGLGFAGSLADVTIPAQYFVPALLTFNVGVEIGQFFIIAAVVPYLVLMRQHKHWWESRLIYGVSGVIGGIGLLWVVQRIIGALL